MHFARFLQKGRAKQVMGITFDLLLASSSKANVDHSAIFGKVKALLLAEGAMLCEFTVTSCGRCSFGM